MIRQAWLVPLILILPLTAWAQSAAPPGASAADSSGMQAGLSVGVENMDAPVYIASASTQLQPMTVLGTRTEKAPNELPRSIDVVRHNQIAHQQDADLVSIVQNLPNVSAGGGPRAVGKTVRIRGLSGDNVLLLVDGAEQGYSVGHVAGGFISPYMIESVQLERGPASVLWGSGAIGGVVSVDTKDAADLLDPGQSFGALLYSDYQSNAKGWMSSGAVYGHLGERVDALFQVGRRSNENLRLGNGESLQDSSYRRTSALAKSTVYIGSGNSLQLVHRRSRLDGISPTNPNQDQGSLEDRKITVGSSVIEWKLLPDHSKLIDLTTRLSHIRTESTENQVGSTQRENTVVAVYGVDVANTSRLDLGVAGQHALTYGVDLDRASVDSTKDGQSRTLVPSGQRLISGVFAQDEIRWSDDWTTTLGLRYDYYRSEPDDDKSQAHNDSALSAQAGLLWQATDWLQLHASYAEAFRAPSVSELFSNGPHMLRGFVLFNLQPNPNLKPEQAANKEIGLRTRWHNLFAAGDLLRFEFTAFRNDVDDFIQDVCIQNCGSFRPGPPTPVLTYDNVTKARLQGFETTLSYATDAWFVGLDYGQTRGDNETTGEPLPNMPADTWVLRAGLTALPWDGRVTWRMTYAENQQRVPPDDTLPIPVDSSIVHDLLTTWYPVDDVRIDAGVGNLTDVDYRVAGTYLPASGRNIKLGVTLKF